MKEFFAFLGKLLGFAGRAGKGWGHGLALLPHLVQIMMFVQALRGRGTGPEKRKIAIDLFRELLEAEGYIAKPLSPELKAAFEEAIGACVDAGITLDKVIGALKNP